MAGGRVLLFVPLHATPRARKLLGELAACTLVDAAVSSVPSVDLLVCCLLGIWGAEGGIRLHPGGRRRLCGALR